MTDTHGTWVDARTHVWWDPADPTRIRCALHSGEITDAAGERGGLSWTASSNLASADYQPNNFNRLARLLRSRGKEAPDEVEELPRQLARRTEL